MAFAIAAMLNLFSLKNKELAEGESGQQGGKKKASAAQLRITKDINELELPKTCKTAFADPNDLLNFKLIISPDEGFYRGGQFHFSFKIGPGYPHEPPKVKCITKVGAISGIVSYIVFFRCIIQTSTWRAMCV